jgi:two-component system, cell cycle sensor histidine kinase and response regulator CckA
VSERVADARWRHDVKNQLGIVLGFSELLLEDLDPTSPVRADLEEILKAARRAMALVEEIEDKPMEGA